MKQEFIPYEQALEIKELGFDEPCLAFYDGKNAESFYFNNTRDASGDYIPFQKHDRLKWFGAPLYQQAFRWFREKYQIIPEIRNWGGTINQWYYMIHHNDELLPWRWIENKSYEEAELECLKKLIEIVKEGTK